MRYIMFINLVNSTVEDYQINTQILVEKMGLEHGKMCYAKDAFGLRSWTYYQKKSAYKKMQCPLK